MCGYVTDRMMIERIQSLNENPKIEFEPPLNLRRRGPESLLNHNSYKPIYCLSLVFEHRTVDLVFQNFYVIEELVRDYFIPLKFSSPDLRRIYVPSIGSLLWRRFKYLLYWNLSRNNIFATANKRNPQKPFTFAQMVILSSRALI